MIYPFFACFKTSCEPMIELHQLLGPLNTETMSQNYANTAFEKLEGQALIDYQKNWNGAPISHRIATRGQDYPLQQHYQSTFVVIKLCDSQSSHIYAYDAYAYDGDVSYLWEIHSLLQSFKMIDYYYSVRLLSSQSHSISID